MLRPAGARRQSNPQPSAFEAALRHNEPLLRAATVTVPSGAERHAAAITGTPEVPAFDPGRTVTWKVDGSAVRFDLAALLTKPAVTATTPLNATNAVVHSMGSTLCMLARSTDSPSQFLFSAGRAGTYSVAIAISSIDLEPWARRSNATQQIPAAKLPPEALTQLDRLTEAPPVTNYTAGDVVNVGGVLHVLAEQAGTNEIHGTAARDGDYYGVRKIEHTTDLGKWSDPALRAEFVWAGRDADDNALQEGIPLAKMRLPKTLWPSANPPAVLQAQVRGDGWADFGLNRAPAHDTTTAYGWEAEATGNACTTQPGDQFVLGVYTDAAFAVPFPLSETDVWKYLNPAVPQRSADQVAELARDAAGKALAGGGGEADADVAFAVDEAGNKIRGTLKDGAVDPAKLEAGTVAQKIALRRAIGAEGELQAGVGVVIGAPDRNGVRQVGVQNPTAVAGGALGAEDAYKQTRLDRLHDWKIEAIQYTEPHVINLTWAPGETPQIYEGSTEIKPGVAGARPTTGLLGYVPLAQSQSAYRGKFTLTTEPNAGDTLANLFSAGTVISLILKIGADLAAAKAAAPITIPVERDTGITNGFAMVAKERLKADPAGLAAANAVAIIDFGLAPIYSGLPDDRTVSAALVTQALQATTTIAGITTDGTTLYLLDRQTKKVGAITLSTLIVDNTKEIAASLVYPRMGWAGGITTDGTNLYITGRGNRVLVYQAGAYLDQLTIEDHATGITFDGTDLLVGVDTFMHVGPQKQASVKGYSTTGRRITAKDVPASVFSGINPPIRNIAGLAWNPDENLLYVTDRGGRIVAIRGSAYDADSTPPSNVTGGTRVGGLAYRDGVLWAAGSVNAPVVPFRVTSGRAAYQQAYDFRTVDQPELRRLVREQHVRALTKAGGTLSWTEVREDGSEATGTWTPPVRTKAVARLPAPGTAGRQVWVEADYDKGAGVNVVPAPFAGTEIAGQGWGSRGVWLHDRGGRAVGQLVGAWTDLILLSENTLAVRHGGAATRLNKLHVSGVAYLLSAAMTDGALAHASDEVAADAYDITGTLPDGVWSDVYAEGATDQDLFPASVTVRQGEYLDTGAAWVPAGFNAPPGDPQHDFQLLIEETIPGDSQTQAVVFAAVAGTPGLYRAAAPFGAIDSIEFDARAASATLNRYVVRLHSDLAVGGGIPAVLRVGASRYVLAAGTPADGEAVFVTSPIEASDRVAAGSLSKRFDLQYASGAWANGSGQQTLRRTLNREALQAAAAHAPAVTHLPRAPGVGRRVQLLASDTLDGFGVLAAAAGSGSRFAGYAQAGPALGSLEGAPDNGVTALLSYFDVAANGASRNKTQVRATAAPRYVRIDGRRYGVAAVGQSSGVYNLSGADGALLRAGRRYRVQVEWAADGTKAYPERTYAPADYTFNGLFWAPTPGLWTQAEIAAWFAPQAQAANAEAWPLAKLPISKLTQAQYDAGVAAGTIANGNNRVYLIVG